MNKVIGDKDSTLNIISAIHETLIQLADTVLWGKAIKQSVLTLDDVKQWFWERNARQQRKIAFGAVIMIADGTSSLRIYQGLFDKKMMCFEARQLIVNQLEKDLELIFAGEDLVVFAESPLNDVLSSQGGK